MPPVKCSIAHRKHHRLPSVGPPHFTVPQSMKILFTVGMAALSLLQSSGGKEVTPWPPKGTTAVRAFSFAGGPENLITNGDGIHPTARPNGGLLLTPEQAAVACAALNTSTNHFGSFYLCFEPRDALVFYDTEGSILASISICFTCFDAQATPNSFKSSFDYAELATFFATLNLDGGFKFSDPTAANYGESYDKKVAEWQSRAEEKLYQLEPWKKEKPSATRRLIPGDEVSIATNTLQDPFDGIKVIDPEGCIPLNLCQTFVQIGGLTEIEASEAVRAAAIEANLYKDLASFTVSVINTRHSTVPRNRHEPSDPAE